jgi:outer membrane protein TolC
MLVIGESLTAQVDSVLTLNEFYRLVFENHPVAQQAEMIKRRGELELSMSRGYFDPKLVSDYSLKEFGGKTYYDLWDNYLKLPTALNLDFKVGFERNSGVYLNPENTVPGGGLYYVGVSVPLGNGLFVNERTFSLRKAKLTKRQLENEAGVVLNNLLFDANFTFWQWNASYQKVELFREAKDLALIKFEGVKEAVLGGDKAPIDSVESLILFQHFQNEYAKSLAEYVKYTYVLENMLWGDSTAQFVKPFGVNDPSTESLKFYEDYAIGNHPELIAIEIKNESLEVDRRFFAEQLKPNLDLNYNFLMSSLNNTQDQGGFQTNNYKAGISFSMPLLLRKERAKLNISKVKISENELKQLQKTREITNKVRTYYNQILTYNQMMNQQAAAIENYQRMLDGERSKFDNGESSVFLVNSRQNKLVDAKLKLIELETAFQIYNGQLLWSSGYLTEHIKRQLNLNP